MCETEFSTKIEIISSACILRWVSFCLHIISSVWFRKPIREVLFLWASWGEEGWGWAGSGDFQGHNFSEPQNGESLFFFSQNLKVVRYQYSERANNATQWKLFKVQLHEISLRSLGNSSTQTANENCEILGRKENLLDRREKIDGGNVLPEPVKEDVQPIQESSWRRCLWNGSTGIIRWRGRPVAVRKFLRGPYGSIFVPRPFSA